MTLSKRLRKQCVQRRNCWSPTFSPFSHYVSQRLLSKSVYHGSIVSVQSSDLQARSGSNCSSHPLQLLCMVGWLVVLGFNATLTAKVISWRSVTHVGVSWLSHTSTNTTFLSKATDYFSHILLQR